MAKKHTIKKFSLPTAKILRFNLKGKAALDTSGEDRAYLIKAGFPPRLDQSDDDCARLAWTLRTGEWFMDFRVRNHFTSKEMENAAFNALMAAGKVPNWLTNAPKERQSSNTANPTPPAA
jgi:hypothetical protein